MAFELRRRKLKFLNGLSLGQICHIVQLGITRKQLVLSHGSCAVSCSDFFKAWASFPKMLTVLGRALDFAKNPPGSGLQAYSAHGLLHGSRREWEFMRAQFCLTS